MEGTTLAVEGLVERRKVLPLSIGDAEARGREL
jgi:hypothetical protein